MATQTRRPAARPTNGKHVNDDIVEGYADIVNELRAIIPVSVLLFGFLLAVARSDLGTEEQWMLFGAMICVATATCIFVLPIVYHRVQFPYTDWEKYQVRAHRFMQFGFPVLGLGFYLSLVLGIWPQFGYAALAISLVPLAATVALLVSRRYIS